MGLATLQGVTDLIGFLLVNFDDGFAILLGTTNAPSSVTISETIGYSSRTTLDERTEGGKGLPKAQIILENKHEKTVAELGGWKNLSLAVRSFRTRYPESWALLEEYALFVRRGGMIHFGNGGYCKKMADKQDRISLRTNRRRLIKIIKTLALYVLTRPEMPNTSD